MSKKIGILTYFWGHNPGTFLQAYSMLKALQKRCPDYRVELINYIFRKPTFRLRKGFISPERLINDYRRFKAFTTLQAKCLPRSSDELNTVDYEMAADYIRKQDYEMIMVGADTVLEFLPRQRASGQVPIYWLPPDIKCKKVMLASVGAMRLDMVDKKYHAILSESVNAFDLVGVRDDNTYDFMKSLGLKDESKLELVPDPTISYEIDYGHIDRLLKKRRVKFDKPIVSVHLPVTVPLCYELVDHYQSRGYRAVISGLTARRRDCRFPTMSPFEWAGVHKYFALKITDRFHGTLFSLRNLAPVVSVDWEDRTITPGGVSKTYSLLRLFGLHETNHLNAAKASDLAETIRVADAAAENHDPQRIAQRMSELTSDFHAYMDKVAALLKG